jgi:Fur family ferric uptake transcriptional regulator
MKVGEPHAWTLEELADGLADDGVAADFSSVFRAATRLEADGIIDRVDLDDGKARFELAGRHHDHLQCAVCGRLVAVPCHVAQSVVAQVEQATGFTMTGHRLVLTGLCPQCRDSAGPGAGEGSL